MTRLQQHNLFKALKPHFIKTIQELALELDYSDQMVRQVMKGNSRNDKILEGLLNNVPETALTQLPDDLKELIQLV